jgi:hypothetical protein
MFSHTRCAKFLGQPRELFLKHVSILKGMETYLILFYVKMLFVTYLQLALNVMAHFPCMVASTKISLSMLLYTW